VRRSVVQQSAIRFRPDRGLPRKVKPMIKDIVVNLSVSATRDVAGAYAVALAEAFGAHVTAVAFAYEAALPPSIMGGIPASFIEVQRAESEKAARASIARFEEAARRAGVSAESRVVAGSLGTAAETFGRMARRSDVAVVGQPEPDVVAPEDLIIEAALFASGRPAVVVPYIHTKGFAVDRVMVCWDGSRNAARAIGDAMPLLARARTIEVVIVAGERAKSDEIPGADIAQHLARHGLKVELERIVSADSDVASTLLSHAADASADFIVMGGYGHSRLREFILGGATRGILGAMTVPVLMSH
jgi:nucleotide-binding universal stress UspA family protein